MKLKKFNESLETINKFDDEFSQYSLGGGISQITFENPIK